MADLEGRVNAAAGTPSFRFLPVYWGDLQPSFAGLEDTIPGAQPHLLAAMRGAERPSTVGGPGLPGVLGSIVDQAAAFGPFEGWAEQATSQARMALLPPGDNGLGDVFVYIDSRVAIQERVREVLRKEAGDDWGTPARPVSMVAHSLGGIISFDAACGTDPALSVRHLVTFGSQVAALHILDPRRVVFLPRPPQLTLEPYHPGQPVVLPPTIGSWLNVWHAMDPLAFLAGTVFRLSDGTPPRDLRIAHEEGSWSHAHSSYWTHTAMPALIAGALRGGGAVAAPDAPTPGANGEHGLGRAPSEGGASG